MILLNLLLAFSLSSHAAEVSYDKGYTTATVVGIKCTTGTVVEITPSVNSMGSHFIGGYRIQNQDSTYSTFIGYDSAVTTNTTNQAMLNKLGYKLQPGIDVPYSISQNVDTGKLVRLYCKSPDAAGASGVIITREAFGYK